MASVWPDSIATYLINPLASKVPEAALHSRDLAVAIPVLTKVLLACKGKVERCERHTEEEEKG